MSRKCLYKNFITDHVFVVSVATALILIWFRKGFLISAGEPGIPFYHPSRSLEQSQYMWGNVILGVGNPSMISIPFYFVLTTLEALGVPAVVLEAFTFWLVLVIGALSIYWLTFIAEKENYRLPAILASIFYMLNPFAMLNIWTRFQYTFMFFYALIPLALLLYLRGLQCHRIAYAFYFNISCLIFSLAFAETPFIGTFWIVISSYFAFYMVTNLRNRSKIIYAVKFSIATFLLWLALNSWWILPFTQTAGYSLQQTTPSGNLGVLFNISNTYGHIFYVVRLIQIEVLKSEVSVWGPIYFSEVFIAISFLIPIIASLPLLLKHKSKLVLYFALFLGLGLFLTKGAAPPLGEVFLWVFTNFQAFQVFRNPVEKFGIILPLAYAPLFGIGLSTIYHFTKSRLHVNPSLNYGKRIHIRKIVAPLLVLLVSFSVFGLYMWPMWNGYVFTSALVPANNPEIGYYVNVPAYYNDANSWLSTQRGDYKLIVLPLDGIGITYNWTYGYNGVELSNQLFNKPSISMTLGIPLIDDVVSRLEVTLINTNNFWKVMALLNARYIVLRSDINYADRNMMSPQEIKQALIKSEHISYAQSFGKLDFYKLDDNCFLDHIYATNQFTFSEDIDTMLSTVTQNESFAPGNSILFLRSQSEVNNITLLESLKTGTLSKPNVSFEKIDPTKYVVHISNADGPYFLTFSETYYPRWKVYVNGDQISDNYHFIANGYANSWYISKTGSYDVVLEFSPQRLLYIGSAISVVTFIFCAIYISRKHLRALYLRLLRKKPINKA